MSKLHFFQTESFIEALRSFFKELKVPVNYIADEPTSVDKILSRNYSENDTFQMIEDVYLLGIVDNAAFEGNQSLTIEKIQSDYDGILLFGVTLHQRINGLLPTRSQLAEVARAFNREFYYTPVVIVFKYDKYLAFANTERQKYKQEWREGEKAGKVSLLRDINIQKPHRGHSDILEQLQIPTSGKNAVISFATLYAYWQNVFNVNILNKKFYQELSNWYFWAVKQVVFPSKPTAALAHKKGAKLEDLVQEHNATNVIRLLTRLLFTWFIKEKGLIPENLFDLKAIQQDILKEISPYHEKGTMFSEASKESIYYKAILQNLFFATLNCPLKADGLDNRSRSFRGDGYGTNRGIDYLMRYKKYFKKPDAFLQMMNEVVPFLNGGLFECLDDKYQNIYIDGFSDGMTKGEQLVVPDFLFFGVEEKVDLSKDYGISNKGTKEAAVKGLIEIFKSYKFTITENTPIEEDVALDPELLGRVFENLLASYNPETKTTARKQTGSFYTPREIVNYMVDESIIAYLRTKILENKEEFYVEMGKQQTSLFGNEGKVGQLSFEVKQSVHEFKNQEDKLDNYLHELVSYNPGNPFKDYPKASRIILEKLDQCKILDPACGSGAFPMGVLQKMVHILQKLDPENKIWKDVQKAKAKKDADEAFEIEDKEERSVRLKEIDEAFDRSINDPDYARKLYLIENCIYGVDIQPIATQISKLRFFISLVTEQKVNKTKENFGIRPLPNLETRFVTANTLIQIEKPKAQGSLFNSAIIKQLEIDLKKVRHKLFGARTKDTKLKYRKIDEELRKRIGEELIKSGWPNDTAEKLSGWDPYDQNASSSFFDQEWMFDISNGFDIVIGNPPYVQIQKLITEVKKDLEKQGYETFIKTGDLYQLFYEAGMNRLTLKGHLCFITQNKWMRTDYGQITRNYFGTKCNPKILVDFGMAQIFESATTYTNILLLEKNKCSSKIPMCRVKDNFKDRSELYYYSKANTVLIDNPLSNSWIAYSLNEYQLIKRIEEQGKPLKDWNITINRGILTGFNEAFIIDTKTRNKLIADDPKSEEVIKPILRGEDIKAYFVDWDEQWIIFIPWHFPLHLDPSVSGVSKKAERLFSEQYPAIYQHLLGYKPQLSARNKAETGVRYEWYCLQRWAANYFQDFSKPKIIYPNITKYLPFVYDKRSFFTNDLCYIITGESLEFLTAFFNSRLFRFAFREYFPELLGDSRKLAKVFFEKVSVKPIKNETSFKKLVLQIQKQKEKGETVEEQLKEIDNLIFDLYELTSKERSIINASLVEADSIKSTSLLESV